MKNLTNECSIHSIGIIHLVWHDHHVKETVCVAVVMRNAKADAEDADGGAVMVVNGKHGQHLRGQRGDTYFGARHHLALAPLVEVLCVTPQT